MEENLIRPSLNTTSSKLRLLIVDDEPLILGELEEALADLDMEIITAGNGIDALDYIRLNEVPDIVLTDINMPVMDGFSFVEEVTRLLPMAKQCAFIFASGHGTVPNVTAALRLNAVDFIEKPMGRIEVCAAVNSARKKLALHRSDVAIQTNLMSEITSIRDRTNELVNELLVGQTIPVPSAKYNIKLNRDMAPGDPKQLYLDQIAKINELQLLQSNLLENFSCDGDVWKMLIFLFDSQLKQQNVSVTSLCFVGNNTQTTALRKIEAMEEMGLIERRPDEKDRRRRFVILTDKSVGRIASYLSTFAKLME
jgi:FixJ family two-component response regulator/DNA-binding MarR family transcriptional regulator